MESQQVANSTKDDNLNKVIEFTSPNTIPMLLPENWENILLRDLLPKDFLSAINTCHQWNQLMHSKKGSALFPLVVPMMMRYLPLNQLLEFRLVNKNIKQAVDIELQKYSICSMKEYAYVPSWKQTVNSSPSKVELVRSKFEFERQQQLQGFLHKTESVLTCGGNPFLSGNLSIQLGLNGVDDGDDGECLHFMLSKFGRHTSSVFITDLDYYTAPEECVLRLISLLTLVPNLKILQISGTIQGNREMEFFTPDTLPDLPQLESLDLSSFIVEDISYGESVPVILPLLHLYGAMLKVFKCNGLILGAQNVQVGLLNNVLPNVRCVQVDDIHANPTSLLKLTSVNWKLEQLRVSGHKDSGTERCCQLVDVVRVGNQHAESLTTLELYVTLSFDETRSEERLGLKAMTNVFPRLKRLCTTSENLKSAKFWEFMKVCCANLEEFHVRVRMHDIFSQEEQMLAKSAFQLLKKLRMIVVTFHDKPKMVFRK